MMNSHHLEGKREAKFSSPINSSLKFPPPRPPPSSKFRKSPPSIPSQFKSEKGAHYNKHTLSPLNPKLESAGHFGKRKFEKSLFSSSIYGKGQLSQKHRISFFISLAYGKDPYVRSLLLFLPSDQPEIGE